MSDLTLKGTLNLMGTLTLKPAAGGKLKIGAAGLEALIEVPAASGPPQCSGAPPVMLPPPPAGPVHPEPTVWITNSFNKTVKVQGSAGTANIVALGMAMQGPPGAPVWPGIVQPSLGNPTVTITHVPVNVVNDLALILPSGGPATFTSSGQL